MCDLRGVVDTSIPLPAGLPFNAASGDQTPLLVCQWVVHLPVVIQHQAVQIAALAAPARSQRQGTVLDHVATMLRRVSSRVQEG
jgi:hypothetical protein